MEKPILWMSKSSEGYAIQQQIASIREEFKSALLHKHKDKYLMNRKHLRSKMKTLMSEIDLNESTPIDARYYLINDCVLLDILSHLGLYDILCRLYRVFGFDNLLKLKLNGNEYDFMDVLVAAFGATEQFDVLLNVMHISECQPEKWYALRFKEISELALIMIENQNNPSVPFRQRLFEKILFYLYSIKYQGMQWIKIMEKGMVNQTLEVINVEEFGRSLFMVECVLNDAQCLLGYIMMLFCNQMHHMFQSYSKSTLKRLFLENGYNNDWDDGSVYTLDGRIRKLKAVQSSQYIYDSGRNYALHAFNWKKRLNENRNNHTYPLSLDIYCDTVDVALIMGKAYSLDKQYNEASFTLIQCSRTAHCAYKRVIALKSLSINCYENKHYLLGFKALKCAFKICGGYMNKTFVDHQYRRLKRKIKRKWNAMSCATCGSNKIKLKCCIGCMNTVYCSRQCQKIDWNDTHRYKCSGIWTKPYYTLQMFVFRFVRM
eukprot:21930_1